MDPNTPYYRSERERLLNLWKTKALLRRLQMTPTEAQIREAVLRVGSLTIMRGTAFVMYLEEILIRDNPKEPEPVMSDEEILLLVQGEIARREAMKEEEIRKRRGGSNPPDYTEAWWNQ